MNAAMDDTSPKPADDASDRHESSVSPAASIMEDESPPCPACGSTRNEAVPPSFVYAIGRIEARFPSDSVQRELSQAIARTQTAGLTDRQAFHGVLSERENRYLAREFCWVLTIEGLEVYLLRPYDPADFGLLVEAVRAEPDPKDVDVVIGVRGPLAPPEMCNGLQIPVVTFDQIYSFDVDSLIRSIPKPENVGADQFEPAAREIFDRIQQLADNTGASDDHRALNYLAVRYPGIYGLTSNAFGRNLSLVGVETRLSRLSGVRRIVDVIFSFTHRETDVTEKQFVRVDVSGKYPFLVSKHSPYYDR